MLLHSMPDRTETMLDCFLATPQQLRPPSRAGNRSEMQSVQPRLPLVGGDPSVAIARELRLQGTASAVPTIGLPDQHRDLLLAFLRQVA